MAKLEILCIHCSATPEGQNVSAKTIVDYHKKPVKLGGRGWDRAGYSDIIELNGSIVNVTPYNEDDEVQLHEITWGAVGINAKARHVCYIGGVDRGMKQKDTRTSEQEVALVKYVLQTIARHPDIKIAGHNQFAAKACPSFDVPNWCRLIRVPEKNIWK